MLNMNLVEAVSFVHDVAKNILGLWLLKNKGPWQGDLPMILS
jgi:hypothetical protein